MITLICLYLLIGFVFVGAICIAAIVSEGFKSTVEQTDWVFAACNVLFWPVTMLMWYEESAPFTAIHANLSRLYNKVKGWLKSITTKQEK